MGDFKAKSVCSSRRWNGKTVWDGFSRGAKSLPDFGNKMGCSSSFPVVWCLRIGAGLNPILSPALPTRSSSAPGANLPPGNPRPGCGREVWVERQRDCYNLHFFLANFKQTFGQSSQLQLENSRCLPPGRSEELPEPRNVSAADTAAASGNCSSLRVPAQRRHRSCRNRLNPSGRPRWEPGRGL